MSHCITTTLTRIVRLYGEAGQLLMQEDGLSEADQIRFAAIRVTLDQMWTKRRAELVFAHGGPPRIISAADPSRHQQVRRFAHGIQPLPSGGD